MEVKYEECYVAFLDILGFKNILSEKTCEEIFSIFVYTEAVSHTVFKLQDSEVEALSKVNHKIMSDSIVLYIKADVNDSLFALLRTCQNLQIALLLRSNPVLVRGGISKGDLFVNNDIIYGKGLRDAYLIESKKAENPKIVIDDSLINDVNISCSRVPKELFNICYFKSPDDNTYMINFLAPDYIIPLKEAGIQYVKGIINFCQNEIDKHNTDSEEDKKIRQKNQWVLKITYAVLSLNFDIWSKFSGWKEYLTQLKEENKIFPKIQRQS